MRISSVIAIPVLLMTVGCSGSTDTTSLDDVRLETPTSLTATRIGVTSVKLAWEDHSVGEDSYAIERRRSGGGSFVPLGFAPANSLRAVDSLGLTADSTYVYRVRAFHYVTSSGYSNEVTMQFTLPYP